jgi:hypothetical protein
MVKAATGERGGGGGTTGKTDEESAESHLADFSQTQRFRTFVPLNWVPVWGFRDITAAVLASAIS